MALRYRRVVVIGICGAGKSTLSRRLAPTMSLPLIELDRHHWKPGWRETPREEWRDSVRGLVAADAWVMDGNYTGSLDIRLPRADAIVWLDYSRVRCIRRVLRRVWRNYWRTREGMPEGCPERLDFEFLIYIWTFQRRVCPRIERAIAEYGNHARLFPIIGDAEWGPLVAALTAA